MECKQKSVTLPKMERLSPRVFRVLGCNSGPYTFQGTNTYLVGTSNRLILIDTGDYGDCDYISELQKVLANQKAEICQILVTHWHGDHLGGANEIIRNLLPEDRSRQMKVSKIRRKQQSDSPSEADNGYYFVEEGHVFETEGATLRAIHTPGHSDDHMSLYLEEERALFSGDFILGASTPIFENLGAYYRSLEKIQKEFGSNLKRIYPGHGPVIEKPGEKLKDYLRNIERRERLIFGALKKAKKKGEPVTAEQIVDELYLGISVFLRPGAIVSVMNHLRKLEEEERVCHNGSGLWKLPQ